MGSGRGAVPGQRFCWLILLVDLRGRGVRRAADRAPFPLSSTRDRVVTIVTVSIETGMHRCRSRVVVAPGRCCPTSRLVDIYNSAHLAPGGIAQAAALAACSAADDGLSRCVANGATTGHRPGPAGRTAGDPRVGRAFPHFWMSPRSAWRPAPSPRACSNMMSRRPLMTGWVARAPQIGTLRLVFSNEPVERLELKGHRVLAPRSGTGCLHPAPPADAFRFRDRKFVNGCCGTRSEPADEVRRAIEVEQGPAGTGLESLESDYQIEAASSPQRGHPPHLHRSESARSMSTSRVIANITISLDAYVAGPNQSEERPFGDDGGDGFGASSRVDVRRSRREPLRDRRDGRLPGGHRGAQHFGSSAARPRSTSTWRPAWSTSCGCTSYLSRSVPAHDCSGASRR